MQNTSCCADTTPLGGVGAGILGVIESIAKQVCLPQDVSETKQNSSGAAAHGFPTRDELLDMVGKPDVVVVELRPMNSSEATDGALRTLKGAVSFLWDDPNGKFAVDELPWLDSTPIVVICRTGRRAGKAAAYLRSRGYTSVLNGGGPKGPSELWDALVARYGEVLHTFVGGLRQLFDGAAPQGGGSSTYTYILSDDETKEAIIIDPVLEQAERDLAEVEKTGCRLVLALNTHCHADHITATGKLKELVPGLRSVISRSSGAMADILVDDQQTIAWANGKRTLTVLATPGHTNGCVSFYEAANGFVCTGDAMLIGGCGRTDFQEGSAEKLHDSVHQRLFTLPPATLVLPGHDYKSRGYSTIEAEHATNPRLTKTKAQFVELMANLDLPYPKKIDAALPANMRCGIQDMLESA